MRSSHWSYRRMGVAITVLSLFMMLALPLLQLPAALAATNNRLIYDEAGLLTSGEIEQLQVLARSLGSERETDIIIWTSKNTSNQDVVKMTEDFYDEMGPGYDKRFGNTVILTLDMRNRDIYLAGFYKAEKYLDDARLDKIRNRITPDLSEGNYYDAFETYIQTAHRYMGFEPGVNPDNILFELWFQVTLSVIIGGTVVGLMARGAGGRVTVNRQTYEDAKNMGVLQHRDTYLRTTVTKTKIEKSSSSGGSGGGGGMTGGGHSHSGSRGSF